MKRALLSFPLLLLACGPEPAPALEAPDYAGWAWCPDVVPSVAPEEGELWVQISPSALYCGQPNSTATDVQAVLDDRTQLRLVPGDIAIPLEEGEHPIHIQACERGARDEAALDVGRAFVRVNDVLGRDRVELLIEQPLAGDRTLQIGVAGWRDELSAGLLIDGRFRSPTTEPFVRMQVCEGPCVPEEEGERASITPFDSCNLGAQAPRERHRIVAENGDEVEFTLRNAGNNIQLLTQIEHARGTIDGQRFLQADFFDLALFSETWTDERNYLVRFDEPVGDVCGLRVEGVYPYDNAVWGGNVVRLRCDGFERTERLVINEFEIETIEE